MGKGGRNYVGNDKNPEDENKQTEESTSKSNYSYKTDILNDIPSLNTIRKALPVECFEPTVLESMSYVAKDIIFITILYMALVYVENLNLNFWVYLFVYPIYWYTQGTLFTSIFVLGHDCGHGSFSKHKILNDIMGTLLHTFILAPYYPWKITHRKHHTNTANIDKDEVFYPKRKSEVQECKVDGESTLPMPPGFGLALGWYVYLVKGYCPRHINHFNPFEKMFAGHLFGVLASLISYASWCVCLFYYGKLYGFTALFNHHLIPVVIFGCYIVIITFLHHNEPELGWYPDEEWNYVKGQLSTVDRHYGLVHGVIHNIGTHQIHHLFTSVPHYRLEKATESFRKQFPNLVHIKDDRIFPAFFKMFKVFVKQNVIDDISQKNFKAFYYTFNKNN